MKKSKKDNHLDTTIDQFKSQGRASNEKKKKLMQLEETVDQANNDGADHIQTSAKKKKKNKSFILEETLGSKKSGKRKVSDDTIEEVNCNPSKKQKFDHYTEHSQSPSDKMSKDQKTNHPEKLKNKRLSILKSNHNISTSAKEDKNLTFCVDDVEILTPSRSYPLSSTIRHCDESENETAYEDDGVWGLAQEKEFLENLKSYFNPKSTNSYRKEMQKFDWNKFTSEFYEDMSVEEAKEKFASLTRKTFSLRNAHQFIEGAQNKRKVGISAFTVFIKDNKELLKGKNEHDRPLFANFQNMYKNLSPDEKQKYSDKAKKEKILGPYYADSPVKFYHQSIVKKQGLISLQEAKAAYRNLSLKKRLKYVKRTIRKFQSSFTNPDTIRSVVKNFYVMDKKLYLWYKGGPHLFLNSENEEIKLNEYCRKSFQDFYESADDFCKYFIETALPCVLLPERRTVRRLKEVKRPSEGSSKDDFMLSEPEMPPKSLFAFYCSKYGKESMSKKELRETFKAQSDKKRQKLKNKHSKVRNNYLQTLLQYVHSLTLEQQKQYLGFRRRAIFHFFTKDVFRKDFPSDEFPVYEAEEPERKSQKKEKKDSKRAVNDIDEALSNFENDLNGMKGQ